jgi:hypothetical protein
MPRTRLGRAVALKVISHGWSVTRPAAGDAETEARGASALNHPVIVTIYDNGESDDMSWDRRLGPKNRA